MDIVLDEFNRTIIQPKQSREVRCNKCGETDKAKFCKSVRERSSTQYCKACYNQWAKERYRQQGGKTEERYHAEWVHHLRREFGITEEEYDAMFCSQMGLCASCGNAETQVNNRTGRVYKLAVDHDHVSGLVRGLLCWNCNIALGHLKDSSLRVKQLLKYVDERCV